MADDNCCSSPELPEQASQDFPRVTIGYKAQFFKALGDEHRLTLVYLIDSATSESVCVCDLTEPLGLKQSTVSHHLKILTDAGVLLREKRGTWVHYSINPHLQDFISNLWKEDHHV